ncbi:Neurotransmitter-gated ion-channel ligand binding domain protein [Oesophagostomum dentatum]|uniref:Neurotransmitter-gated ion-channel ligand binding domain protein n=1 Tax=Oesophagostomum dentatum TaxID=61180 RepID=A0A0B1TVQ1_OESDE|nr:Neurotransmitter-gated ion-channel ligand binding domain protein [Oesophagostomum dentatum]
MLLVLSLLLQVYSVKSLSGVYDYQSPRRCANDTEIIDHLLFDTALHYNKHKLPSNPVDVRIEMWVQEVTSVSELTQDFEIDLYMNEYWTDPGLAYDILNPCQGNLSFDWTVLQNIWTPNTCFINSKKAQIHSSPFRNVFLMVFPNGSIWSNWRIKSTGPCKMDLSKFPMDTIECILTFESFNYNKEEVHMRWSDSPLIQYKDIELPDFSMVNYSTSDNLTLPFQIYVT